MRWRGGGSTALGKLREGKLSIRRPWRNKWLASHRVSSATRSGTLWSHPPDHPNTIHTTVCLLLRMSAESLRNTAENVPDDSENSNRQKQRWYKHDDHLEKRHHYIHEHCHQMGHASFQIMICLLGSLGSRMGGRRCFRKRGFGRRWSTDAAVLVLSRGGCTASSETQFPF